MREIKFRGKNAAGFEGKWVFGHYTEGSEDFHYITNPNGSVYLVHPKTVGQFTGLKDMNGKEIYEGDILGTKFFPQYVERISWEGEPDAVCEVYWDFSGFGLKAQGKEDFRYPMMCEMNYEETEVIGNIYENPELLKS